MSRPHDPRATLILFALLAGCPADPVSDAGTDAPSSDAPTGTDAGSDTGAVADAPVTDAPAVLGDHIAIVVGTLAGAPAAIQPMHDAIAMGGEAGARGAGNVHHEIFLGTSLLGTEMDQFLATDRWTSLDGARAIYSNPDFIAAFSLLFASPTMPVLYTRAGWHEWGDLDAADASTPRFFAVVRGRLASSDLTAMRTLHDAVASGGEAMARMVGDVGHVVFLGEGDPREFLAIDIWTSSTAIEALYSNPDFMMALGPLFAAPPTIGIYQSTTWHQW